MSLLSNEISLNLAPKTGSSKQPLPFPPVSDMLIIDSISKSCGSTKTFSTEPDKIGSTNAVTPLLDSTIIWGGFNISYPSPPFNTCTSSNAPKKILSSDIGEWIWTPSFNIPISFTGVPCSVDTNKFWDSGILLSIWSASSFLLECLCRTKEWFPTVVLPIPTRTVLAVPIWLLELYNAILWIVWPAGSCCGST